MIAGNHHVPWKNWKSTRDLPASLFLRRPSDLSETETDPGSVRIVFFSFVFRSRWVSVSFDYGRETAVCNRFAAPISFRASAGPGYFLPRRPELSVAPRPRRRQSHLLRLRATTVRSKKKKVSTEHAPRSLNDAQKQQQNRIPRPVPSASLHLHWNRLDHSSTWFLRKKKKGLGLFFFLGTSFDFAQALAGEIFRFFFELWVELGRQGVGLKILGLSSMPHRNVKWTYQLRSVAWDSHRYRHQRRANTTIVRRRRRGSSTHRSLVFAVTEPSDWVSS